MPSHLLRKGTNFISSPLSKSIHKVLALNFQFHLAMSKPFYFIFAVFIMTCHAANDSNTTTPAICAPSDCGNGIPIQYPFWKINASGAGGLCGYPEFGLNCSKDGRPIIKLITNSYFVTDINYDSYSITLLDIDVVNQTCPRAKHSVSLGSYPLTFSQLDQNITFYFNCSSNLPVSPIPCLDGKNSAGKNSYVFYSGQENNISYDWQRNCDPVIVVTVKQQEIHNSGLIDGFGAAMNKGFVLNWTKAVNCAECEVSGGYCGFNETTKVSMCVCEDGRIVAKSCKGHTRWNRKAKLGVGVGAAMLAVIAFAALLSICCQQVNSCCQEFFWFSNKIDNQDIEAFLKNHGDLALKRYKFSDVKKMTNSFKTKLGQGGFGSVYKGKLLNGSNVAVKILSPSKGNGEEFINEVASISRTSHVNIVTLLGFCFEGHKKVLIYEFMSNGSLDKYICEKGHEKISSLSWDRLYQIAMGIARGLEYLHRGCNTRILHFDIKPHNILLDENFCPKISDFGLAKLCPRKESIISMSNARGTIGYIAPEVCNRHFGGVSHKSDVYSYGMMLLEIVGEKDIEKAKAETSHPSSIYFPDWIYKKFENDGHLGVDGEVTTEENKVIKRMTMVGLWCIQTIPNDRPTMTRVVEMLESSMSSLEMPPKPVLSSPVRSVVESSTTINLVLSSPV